MTAGVLVQERQALPVVSAEPAAVAVDLAERPTLKLYVSVGLVAGAVIALQICIMRVFAVGSWAHFGSLVVSLAMLGFGLTSAVMCVAKAWFERHWRGVTAAALLSFGPLTAICNLIAQQVPFNAIFLLSDRRKSGGSGRISCSICCRSSPARSFSARSFSRRKKPSGGSILPISPARGCAGCCSWARCICSSRRI